MKTMNEDTTRDALERSLRWTRLWRWIITIVALVWTGTLVWVVFAIQNLSDAETDLAALQQSLADTRRQTKDVVDRADDLASKTARLQQTFDSLSQADEALAAKFVATVTASPDAAQIAKDLAALKAQVDKLDRWKSSMDEMIHPSGTKSITVDIIEASDKDGIKIVFSNGSYFVMSSTGSRNHIESFARNRDKVDKADKVNAIIHGKLEGVD